LGYYNSIKNDSDGVIKASKKIDKYLTNVQDIIKNNEKNIQYDNLYNQYNYYNIMLKSSININNINNNSSAIKESQASFKKMSENNKIQQNEMDLLNLCILEKDDLKMSTKFKSMEELFKKWAMQKIELKSDKIILMYFYLYNQVSSITKKVLEELNSENIKQVRKFVTDIIDMTGKQVVDKKNEFMKKIFQLPFFKNLFNRLYYVKLFTFFLEGKYQECLNNFSDYKLAKIQYELETPKSNEYMKKIEADCFFKLKKYKQAEESYDKIIAMGSSDPFVHFNLGLTAFFNDNKQKAIEELEKADNIFKKENNKKNSKIAEEILYNLKK
jgi:hypothetical protein